MVGGGVQPPIPGSDQEVAGCQPTAFSAQRDHPNPLYFKKGTLRGGEVEPATQLFRRAQIFHPQHFGLPPLKEGATPRGGGEGGGRVGANAHGGSTYLQWAAQAVRELQLSNGMPPSSLPMPPCVSSHAWSPASTAGRLFFEPLQFSKKLSVGPQNTLIQSGCRVCTTLVIRDVGREKYQIFSCH